MNEFLASMQADLENEYHTVKYIDDSIVQLLVRSIQWSIGALRVRVGEIEEKDNVVNE